MISLIDHLLIAIQNKHLFIFKYLFTQEIDEKISQLQASIEKEHQNVEDAEKWINLVKQYEYPAELTAELLNTLIEKILIHEPVKLASGYKDQEIEIFYRFVGKLD